MLSFICTTFTCVQMYLGGAGAGKIIAESQNFLIYSTYRTEYVCNVIENMYSCTSHNLISK